MSFNFDPERLPSLHRNGAVDPDKWQPPHRDSRDGYMNARRLDEGDLVAWRYAVWVVHQIRPYQDYDLTDEQRAKLDKVLQVYRPDVRHQFWPFHVVFRHVNGPLVLNDGETPDWKTLHDGTREVSYTSWPHKHAWFRLPDPYMTCSCHGHPWPCQDYDRAVLAAHQLKQMDKLLATTQPGVCAACFEPITTRQRSLTFPEESRFVPGAPGPTFHAGRGDCWRAAENYEREGRLADNPGIVRLASCPGIRFIHEQLGMPAGKRIDCTAGPECTGLHGPAGYRREVPCYTHVHIVANEGGYARPSFDCGYRSGDMACIGGDLSSGGTSVSPTAADEMWRQQHASRQNSGRIL
jgi:hypothetical protein